MSDIGRPLSEPDITYFCLDFDDVFTPIPESATYDQHPVMRALRTGKRVFVPDRTAVDLRACYEAAKRRGFRLTMTYGTYDELMGTLIEIRDEDPGPPAKVVCMDPPELEPPAIERQEPFERRFITDW